MCINKKRIKNNTYTYKRSYDKVYFDVDCGDCPSCRQSIRNDWYVRLYSQYKTYTSVGGVVMFATLTYNDAHLPYFDYTCPSGYKFHIPCFSIVDRQKFVKRLRKRLVKTFGYHSSNIDSTGKPILPINVFIASEYGDEYKRPHYHLLLFIPPANEKTPFIKYKLKAIVERSWRYIETDHNKGNRRHYDEVGFVMWSKESKGGAFVKSFKAIRYTSKYVTKSLEYYGRDDVQELLKYAQNLKDNGDIDEYNRLMSAWKPCRPSHNQSINFGRGIVETLKSSDFKNLIHNGFQILENQKLKSYCIPRYIINKVSYSYGKSPIGKNGKLVIDPAKRYLNDIGAKLAFYMHSELKRKKLSSLQHTFSYINLSNYKPSADSEFAIKYPDLSGAKLFDYVKELFGKYTYDDLCKYCINLRGYAARSQFSEVHNFRQGYDLRKYILENSDALSGVRINRKREILRQLGFCERQIMHDKSVYIAESQNLFNRFFPNLEELCQISDMISADQLHQENLRIEYEQKITSSINAQEYQSNLFYYVS